MLEPSSAIECLDFFHPACAELGFEIRPVFRTAASLAVTGLLFWLPSCFGFE
jgi:hypothetical protein